jgi:neutral ceramidase
LKQLGALADRVVGDVFESFSKHPKDVQKREAEEKARLDAAKPTKP